ncbi:MAG TPA: hypothetical protein VLB44_26325 [Kofleriaceae bacterium]|nr:hypothetical protein [Kofleriaceae bacterium]
MALAMIGCRASEAGPGSGLTPPAGWKALPTLAKAATDAAAAARIVVDGAEAWGEPARGCYAGWLALAGGKGTPDKVADQLVASLTAEPSLAGITVRDVVKPAAGAAAGILSLDFTHAPYTGKLRAQLARDGHIALLACFWNEREPVACETACTQLLGGMK